MAGLFFTDYPPSPPGEPGWLSWYRVWPRTDVLSVRVPPAELNISTFPPMLHNWVIKDLGMSSRVYATGHIKIPCHLLKREEDCLPVVGFLLVSFIK